MSSKISARSRPSWADMSERAGTGLKKYSGEVNLDEEVEQLLGAMLEFNPKIVSAGQDESEMPEEPKTQETKAREANDRKKQRAKAAKARRKAAQNMKAEEKNRKEQEERDKCEKLLPSHGLPLQQIQPVSDDRFEIEEGLEFMIPVPSGSRNGLEVLPIEARGENERRKVEWLVKKPGETKQEHGLRIRKDLCGYDLLVSINPLAAPSPPDPKVQISKRQWEEQLRLFATEVQNQCAHIGLPVPKRNE